MTEPVDVRSPDARTTDDPSDVTLVDPRAPRFGQSITASALLIGVALGRPELVAAVAVALVAAVASGWRLDSYGLLWRQGASHLVGPPAELEPAAPHRFARLVGAVPTSAATPAILAGVPTAGYALATVVALAAGLAALTGICPGCRFYRQVSLARRVGLV